MKKVRSIAEVKNDFIDDENVCHIDVFFTDDHMEEGTTAAWVCLDTYKVFYKSNLWRGNRKVSDAIKEAVQREKESNASIRMQKANYLSGLVRDLNCTAFILWTIPDVKSKAKQLHNYDITDEEAREVLQDMEAIKDCENGLTWSTLEFCLDDFMNQKNGE